MRECNVILLLFHDKHAGARKVCRGSFAERLSSRCRGVRKRAVRQAALARPPRGARTEGVRMGSVQAPRRTPPGSARGGAPSHAEGGYALMLCHNRTGAEFSMPRNATLETIAKLRRKPWRETRLAIWGRLRVLAGLPAPMRTADRELLEGVVLPFFVQRGVERVLFVGTDWFTKHYERLFAGCSYWTIEIDPRRRKFGSAQHVTDSLEHLDRHFSAGFFDLIVCNGVYGWGLDAPAACERAFQCCYDCLREGGVLVLGWNDAPEHRPVPLSSIRSLARFARLEDSPFGAWRYVTETASAHVYDFYRKQAGRG